MQYHQISTSNHGIRNLSRRALRVLGAICFVSAAYAAPALAAPSAAGAVVHEDANTELHAMNLRGRWDAPASNSGTRSVKIAAASLTDATAKGARVDNGGCSSREKWGQVSAQTCINSPTARHATSDAYVNVGPGCSTCKFRFVLELKREIPHGQDPVAEKKVFPYRTARLAIEKKRVPAGKYYTFLRLELKEGSNWIRVHTQESPRVNVR